MLVPTLYSICLNYIQNHTEDISCLDGVPFTPTIKQILDHLYNSDVPLNTSILSVIGESHGKELRNANLDYTNIHLYRASVKSAVPSFTVISTHFPKFITRLRLDNCNLFDDDLLLVRGFSNLKSLDLSSNTSISDKGITMLENIVTSAVTGGMPHLEDLHLCNLKSVTDKSLKTIAKFTMLTYLDISNTSITREVAIRHLPTKGFKFLVDQKPVFDIKSVDNAKFYYFIKKMSFDYDKGQQLLHAPNNKVGRNKLHFTREFAIPKTPIPAPAPKKRKINTTTDYFNMVQQELFRF